MNSTQNLIQLLIFSPPKVPKCWQNSIMGCRPKRSGCIVSFCSIYLGSSNCPVLLSMCRMQSCLFVGGFRATESRPAVAVGTAVNTLTVGLDVILFIAYTSKQYWEAHRVNCSHYNATMQALSPPHHMATLHRICQQTVVAGELLDKRACITHTVEQRPDGKLQCPIGIGGCFRVLKDG